MSISSESVKELRDATGASVMDCKKALEESRGDMKKAQNILAMKSKAVALKKQSREATVGIIGSYVHSNERIGVLVELLCETDFVARTKEFKELAHDVALHIAALKPTHLRPEDFPSDFVKERKKLFAEEVAKEKKPAAMREKIVEAKMRAFLNEHSLLEQNFVKDPGKSVKQVLNEHVATLGEKILVGKFVRFEI